MFEEGYRLQSNVKNKKCALKISSKDWVSNPFDDYIHTSSMKNSLK